MSETKAEVQVVSHRHEVMKATNEAMKKAARMIGGSVVGHAAEGCPVDTGLLRNSLTYAIGGEPAKISRYASDDGSESGKYTGQAQQDVEDQVTVHVGTNVEYAAYVELGHHQQPGRYVPAIGKRLKKDYVPGIAFLRPAMENHREEIKQIIAVCLSELD